MNTDTETKRMRNCKDCVNPIEWLPRRVRCYECYQKMNREKLMKMMFEDSDDSDSGMREIQVDKSVEKSKTHV